MPVWMGEATNLNIKNKQTNKTPATKECSEPKK